ncbi:MAG: SsrA-binding protein SmpB, partial [Dehalococcoidia bacterium]|nr:SsrA-binding protein SmpB [Dehalococcoidia bacterium]
MAKPKRSKSNRHSGVIAVNRRAYHDYDILESVEAGLVLTGTEIKSVRSSKINIQHAFARVERGEMWLVNAHIAPYAQGNIYNHEPTRPRKLLLHNKQIGELAGTTSQKGLTLVPL